VLGRHLVEAPLGNGMLHQDLVLPRRTWYFFSYNLQWFLDLCCWIPLSEVASISRRGRRLVEAPPGNGMLHQDPVLLAELGTSSHIIFNGFWTSLIAFHCLRWLQLAVGADG
jgi:hypothetical protein